MVVIVGVMVWEGLGVSGVVWPQAVKVVDGYPGTEVGVEVDDVDGDIMGVTIGEIALAFELTVREWLSISVVRGSRMKLPKVDRTIRNHCDHDSLS